MFNRNLVLPKNQHFFLFGPRQTGKSTLLKEVFNKPDSFYYYDLLKTEEYTRLLAHPELLREEITSRPEAIKHIIIDEIQRVPNLLNEVHWLMEQPNSPYFILTGSSARALKRSKANLLGGRALTYHLFPLTVKELGSKFSLNKVLQIGSLPSVYLAENPSLAAERLRAYVDTYLKEEIEAEAHLRHLSSFIHFLNLAAQENGQTINFSNLARETGVSYQSIKSYFQILEDTLLGTWLLPYMKSSRKRLSRLPKFYLFDTGVTRALTKQLNIGLEPHTVPFGRAFEHFIILEIWRAAEYSKSDYTFSYYRSERGSEVDLIIEKPDGGMVAIEIKSTEHIDSSHLRGLKSFARICPKAELICVSLAPYRRKIKGVMVLPWQEILSHLGL